MRFAGQAVRSSEISILAAFFLTFFRASEHSKTGSKISTFLRLLDQLKRSAECRIEDIFGNLLSMASPKTISDALMLSSSREILRWPIM